jgi:[lysine-biosynthesis-protein LysW]---L-2-aminoadipate ligase
MAKKLRIGFLHSLIRKDEKLLLDELRSRDDIEVVMLDDREIEFTLGKNGFKVDCILERCINHSRALHALRLFESMGVRCFNSSNVATICGDKLLTSIALQEGNVAQPEVRVAFTEKSAISTIEKMGYPVVLKPAVGSWGRLLTKVNDRDAAEAILEHKTILGSYHHSIFYIQKFVNKKKGRDIRAFVVGNEVIGAIYRQSKHWITNTSRGGSAENCKVTKELRDLCLRAAKAVGGGILGIDVFESKDGLVINEVNYTMEFKNSIETTGVNIPKKVVDYVVAEMSK